MKPKEYKITEADVHTLIDHIQNIERMMSERACVAETAIEKHAFSYYGSKLVDIEIMITKYVNPL